jgi:predicted negative regulator of RcsB-dependent stress response
MSKKHPGAGRVYRQRHDEDVFVESVLEGSVWARQHGRILLIGGIVLFVLLAGGIYYRNYRAQLHEQATAQLNQVRQTVLSGNKQLAVTDLKNYIARFGNTAAGAEARTMLAQLYLSQNQPQEAVTAIEPIADEVDKSPAATFLLASAYEALKQSDKAEQAYLRIAEDARFGFEKREALERAAGLRLAAGNTAGAIELYNRAMETLPEDSPDRAVYEMRIAEIRGAASAPST